ncbi:MAG: hypothetical protein NTX72_00275 [Candidatus Uhrbacteria bacterium]|nr:hypothetical protein [Candidatus Uhrbacteria bacterium]
MTLQPHKTGVSFGVALGLFHLLWSFLIALGVAQPLMDFIFILHRITPVYKILPFDFVLATGLVLVTAAIGYVFGYAFAVIWNKVQK